MYDWWIDLFAFYLKVYNNLILLPSSVVFNSYMINKILKEEEIASTLEKFKGLEKLEILPHRVSS